MTERAEIVRETMAAFNRRDYDQVTDHATEDVEVLPPPEAPEAKVYREAAGYREAVADWMVPWESLQLELLDAVEIGDTLLATCRGVGKGVGSGMELTYEYWQVMTFRGDKVSRLRIFQSRDDAERAMAAANDR